MRVVIPTYLFLPFNKIFFDHFLARTLDFSVIDAPVSIIWDGALSKGWLMRSMMIKTFGRCGLEIL